MEKFIETDQYNNIINVNIPDKLYYVYDLQIKKLQLIENKQYPIRLETIVLKREVSIKSIELYIDKVYANKNEYLNHNYCNIILSNDIHVKNYNGADTFYSKEVLIIESLINKLYPYLVLDFSN